MKSKSDIILELIKIRRDATIIPNYSCFFRPLKYFGEFANEIIDHVLFIESDKTLGKELTPERLYGILEIVDKRIDEADKKERFLKSLITVVDTSQIKTPFNNGITH